MLSIMAAIAIGVLLIVMTVLMCRVICLGRRCAHDGHQHKKKHQRMAKTLLFITVILVLVIELSFGRLFSDIKSPLWLMSIHLPAAILYVGIIVTMIFWKTGEENPHAHRPLAYTGAVFFLVMLITGAALLTFEVTALLV